MKLTRSQWLLTAYFISLFLSAPGLVVFFAAEAALQWDWTQRAWSVVLCFFISAPCLLALGAGLWVGIHEILDLVHRLGKALRR